ncbi:MAG TPA: DUF2203 domain-containing protein [Bryobacteraceae bacterium]|nr:DUF2203 domain-containing protein [Bryobacteraceae bacterium]
MSRRFTLAEAQGLVPRVQRLIEEAIALKSEYDEAGGELEAFQKRVMLMGGVTLDRERALQARQRRDNAATRLRNAVETVQQMGCIIKDLSIGLVDFPTTLRGVEVYLCWKLGETQIEYWHGVDEGFRGRKPIDQDFLDHHEGDPAD